MFTIFEEFLVENWNGNSGGRVPPGGVAGKWIVGVASAGEVSIRRPYATPPPPSPAWESGELEGNLFGLFLPITCKEHF